MSVGYSKTPLAKKLGIKAGFRVLMLNVPEHYFDLFDELPEIEEAGEDEEEIPFVHFFTTEAEALEEMFPRLKDKISKDGMIWVSWPKKSSGMVATLDGNLVRTTGLKAGLVDVKVCAVDEVWSGMKFMYRVKDR